MDVNDYPINHICSALQGGWSECGHGGQCAMTDFLKKLDAADDETKAQYLRACIEIQRSVSHMAQRCHPLDWVEGFGKDGL